MAVSRRETDLLTAIDACYAAMLDPTSWPRVARRVADAAGATACMLAIRPTGGLAAGGTTRLVAHSGLGDDFAARYTGQCADLDPWLRGLHRTRGTGTVLLGVDLVPYAHLIAGAFYEAWLRPQGLYHWCGVVLERDAARLVCLQLLRPRGPGPFDRLERQQIAHLVPHLQRARQVGALLEACRPAEDARMIDLDRPRRHLVADEPALPAEPARGRRRAPLRLSAAADGGEEAALRARFELTSAESRVAALVAEGRAPAEVAAELGIGVNTVRTHLQRLFSKTGARRQPELVARLLRPELAELP